MELSIWDIFPRDVVEVSGRWKFVEHMRLDCCGYWVTLSDEQTGLRHTELVSFRTVMKVRSIRY